MTSTRITIRSVMANLGRAPATAFFMCLLLIFATARIAQGQSTPVPVASGGTGSFLGNLHVPSYARLGTLSSTPATGTGSMTAGTYFWTVTGRTAEDGVGLAPLDTWGTLQQNFTIAGMDNQATLAWTGDSRFAGYLIGVGTVSGQYTTWFTTTNTSLILLHNPAAVPAFTYDHCTANGANSAPPCAAGVLGFALVNAPVASSIRAGCYYAKIEAVLPSSWSDSGTSPIAIMSDDAAAVACLAATNDRNATITYNWTVPTGTVSSNVLLSSTTQGGFRQFLWRVSLGNVLTYSLTQLPENIGTYVPLYSNFDLQSASAIVVGSLQAISDGRSNFAGDLYLSGPLNTEIQTIFNLVNSSGTGASSNVYAGNSYRWNTAECWRAGMWAVDAPSLWSIKYSSSGCGGYSPGTLFSVDAVLGGVKAPLVQAGDGAVGLPAYAGINHTTTGAWFSSGPELYRISVGGVERFRADASGFVAPQAGNRIAADFMTADVATSTKAIAVGALPAAAAGNAGQIRTVSDSTAVAVEGQTCVGGSTNTALAFSNGVVWKCF